MKTIGRKIRSRFAVSLVLLVALVLCLAAGAAQAKPKNVIFFIGDGMGPEQVKAGAFYAYGAPDTLSFELFPYKGELSTDSKGIDGNPNAVTDSAAAATALATGFKVFNGVVSIADGNYPVGWDRGTELYTLLEYFKDEGKMTGLITTAYMAHATPACFGAHEQKRGNYSQIANDYLTQTEPNVLFGGSTYMSGAAGENYTVVTNRAQMLALDTEDVNRVSGQFNSSYMPYEYDGDYSLKPHLSEMTDTALSILDNDSDGFFLMVEGGLIDRACHDNNMPQAVFEAVEFANAVQEAIDWVNDETNGSSWTDTLILVTADHETGMMTVTANNGQGEFPDVDFDSTGHSDANVPVYARGVNSELILPNMDNTDMFDVVTADEPIQLVRPVSGAVEVSTSPTLEVTVYDPDGGSDTVDVNFYGREDAFTIVALPDTQNYVLNGAYPEIFDSQTQWIARNAGARNIVFVTHEGDIVDSNNLVQAEWTLANASMSILDGNVPYGVLPGNHDKVTDTTQGTYPDYPIVSTLFNNTFPYTRYENEHWYGGHYPSTGNNNSYQLFSAGGDDYIIIHLEDTPGTAVISWADGVLKAYPDRKAIITAHSYMDDNGNYNGKYGSTQYIRDMVVANDNVYFVLCGHYDDEHDKTTTINEGLPNERQVHELLADYQNRSNGGNGWLRIMQFVPVDNAVYVYTYSPWLDMYETHADSEFPLDFPMSGGDFSVIGSETGVQSGSNVSTVWSGLSPETQYEWYVTVDDPTSGITQGPTYRFNTAVYWYVDGVDGNDANDGKTWDTAFKTISHAISRAQDGHVIEVAEDTYVLSEALNFAGKAITVTSTDPGDWSTVANTVIYRGGGNYARNGVVNFTSGEGTDSILTGFTIRADGKYTRDGICCFNNSSPTISDCNIENSYLAIDCIGSAPEIKSNKIYNNYQAVWCQSSSEAKIRNNWIYENDYGVEVDESPSVNVIGNTIVYNDWGVYNWTGIQDTPTITNCIIWGNISGNDLYDCNATFSCIKDGDSGVGNIADDPCFVGHANHDYHLRQISHCINKGDNNAVVAGETDIDGEPRIQGCTPASTVVDMGADETPYNAVLCVDVGGNSDGRCWASAFGSIQEAIDAAHDGDIIDVNEGTYYETIDFKGKSITVTSANPDDPNVVASTVIDANSDVTNPGRGVTFDDGEDANSVLTGFTITGGYAPGTGSDRDGGGIFCYGSSPTISKCVITQNYAGDDGGGIFCDSGSDAEISDCNISDNESADKGGAMYCRNSDPTVKNSDVSSNDAYMGGGLYFTASEPLIEDCFITDNQTSGGTEADGGGIYLLSSNAQISNCVISDNVSDDDAAGIYCYDGSDPNIINCTLSGNQADDKGGGIYCKTNSSPNIKDCDISLNNANMGGGIYCSASDPQIEDCNVSGNYAADDAGGIYCYDGSNPTISSCEIIDNEAEDKGGGIYCKTNSSPTIEDCDISLNDAYKGGGIYCASSNPQIERCIISDNQTLADGLDENYSDGGGIYCSSSSPGILNSIISDNASDDDAGGIYCYDGSDPNIINCTFSGNQADDKGGAIYCKTNSDAVITNCILWDDTAPNGSEIYTASSSPVVTYSDIEGGYSGTGNINSDPCFVDANTGDFHLDWYSNCIDAGDPSGDYDGQKDIDGCPRVVGDCVDMGADEVSLPPLAHWRLNEGSGSTAYDSASDYDGTIYGATWTTGQIGGALSFDGNDGVYVWGSAGTGSPLNIYNSDMTISAWFKLDGNGGTIVARSKPHYITYRLLASSTTAYMTVYVSPVHYLIYTDAILSQDTWYHLVGVFDRASDLGYLYVDGILEADGSLPDASPWNDGLTKIGCRNDLNDYPFNGKIDDVRIYDWALSAEEIEEIYLSSQ